MVNARRVEEGPGAGWFAGVVARLNGRLDIHREDF